MSNPAPRWRKRFLCAFAPAALAATALAGPDWQTRVEWPPGEPSAWRSGAAIIADDGSTTLALRRVGTAGTMVVRISPDGTQRWAVMATPPSLRLADCGASICFAGSGLVGQLDAATGAERWTVPRFDPAFDWQPVPGADGGLLLIERTGLPPGGFPVTVSVSRVFAYSATGQLRYETSVGHAGTQVPGRLIGHDGRGALAVYTAADAGLATLDGNGGLVPIATDVPWPYVVDQFQFAGLVGADGAFRYPAETGLADGGNGLEIALLQVRPGHESVATALGTVPFPYGSPNRAYPQLLALSGRDSLVGLEHRSPDPSRRSYLLKQVDAAGSPRWSRRWTTGLESQFRVQSSPPDGFVLLSQRGDDQTVLRALAPDGRLMRQSEPACGGQRCPYDLAAALVDGGDLLIAGAADGEADPHLWVARLSNVLAPAPATAIAQPGLAGAWYAPYTSGQGFTLRLFPVGAGGATVFMPWFTFDRTGSDSTVALRWYALQGDVDADASEATLAIVERRGGVFATAPAGPPVVVGQARLRFSDCASGLLDYRFDPGHNGGAEGSVALTPLLPRGAPCTDADGQVLPAQASYDPALSGHWFDPARSGQGLELSRVAPDAPSDGLLYGAWFTFDPYPAGDMPSDQHWFTVQGQAALAGGGVRTTLIQTLGGRFDSAPAGAPFRVGEADLLPGPDCTALTLRYRFDGTEAAGAFRSRTGEVQLRRLGACPTPQ